MKKRVDNLQIFSLPNSAYYAFNCYKKLHSDFKEPPLRMWRSTQPNHMSTVPLTTLTSCQLYRSQHRPHVNFTAHYLNHMSTPRHNKPLKLSWLEAEASINSISQVGYQPIVTPGLKLCKCKVRQSRGSGMANAGGWLCWERNASSKTVSMLAVRAVEKNVKTQITKIHRNVCEYRNTSGKSATTMQPKLWEMAWQERNQSASWVWQVVSTSEHGLT